jgi:hypothetical protein
VTGAVSLLHFRLIELTESYSKILFRFNFLRLLGRLVNFLRLPYFYFLPTAPTLSPQPSALSPQPSALSPQPSASANAQLSLILKIFPKLTHTSNLLTTPHETPGFSSWPSSNRKQASQTLLLAGISPRGPQHHITKRFKSSCQAQKVHSTSVSSPITAIN